MKLISAKLITISSTPYFSREIYNTIEILLSLTSFSLRPFLREKTWSKSTRIYQKYHQRYANPGWDKVKIDFYA